MGGCKGRGAWVVGLLEARPRADRLSQLRVPVGAGAPLLQNHRFVQHLSRRGRLETVVRCSLFVVRGSLYVIIQGHCCAVCSTRKMVMVSPSTAYTLT